MTRDTEYPLGKPFADEIQRLPETYCHALSYDVTGLASAIADLHSFPLLTVGSGGSFTGAQFAANLHQRLANAPAKAVTPLLFPNLTKAVRGTAVMLLSAGGANPDVLGIFRRIVEAEPARFLVLCARERSPLARLARRYCWVDLFEFDLPSGKDGFLATNSLLAFGAFLTKAYETVTGQQTSLPASLVQLVSPRMRHFSEYVAAVGERSATLWSRDHLLVLYGPDTEPAAIDIESKFTEAALGSVQVADYRNFAHGRHHWIAKRGSSISVLALRTRHEIEIARAILNLLPQSVPVLELLVAGVGPTAGLAAIVNAMILTGHCGQARGIDPGRPGVPGFGRRIYHLRAFSNSPAPKGRIHPVVVRAVERKSGASIERLKERGLLEHYLAAYSAFIMRLCNTPFDGLALDYDGTLCDSRERQSGPNTEVMSEIVRLLARGIRIAVVTGRGQSVRLDLQRHIDPSLWSRLLVGYYNGAQIATLDDDSHPRRGTPHGVLKGIADTLTADPILCNLAACESRAAQIMVTPRSFVTRETVYERIMCLLPSALRTSVSVVQSAHTVDVLAPGVTKLQVVQMLQSTSGAVLAIGDSGRWPGNDFELLSYGFGLSVNEVSSDLSTCWNLTPPGFRSAQATRFYLRLLHPARTRGKFRLRIPESARASS